MEINKKSFKKMFPNLSKEIEGGDDNNKVKIDSVRTEPGTGEAEEAIETAEIESQIKDEMPPDKFRNYNPTVVDFIRRCDTCMQAEEIIDYLERRGELAKEDAKKLREQLKMEGLRSFGSKKEENYYFKQSGFC